MIYIIIFLNVLFLFFTFNATDEKRKWDLVLAEAISAFFGVFIVVAGILWLAGIYSEVNNLMGTTLVNGIVVVVSYFVSRKKAKFFKVNNIGFSVKWLVSRGVILTICFISLGSYAVFGVGRNDGNALVQAFSQSNGNYSLNYEIDEKNTIVPDSKYDKYFDDSLKNMDTKDFTGEYWTENVEREEDGEIIIDEVLMGSYSNNPVYSSLLELGMDIFGLTKGSYLNVFLLFCVLIFLDDILLRINCRWSLRTSLIGLFGIVPLIVYANRTAIAETVMMFCVVAFLYYMISKPNWLRLVSCLFVTALSMINVSAFTVIPVILAIYWVKYISDRKKVDLIASGVSSLGYGLSFLLLLITAYSNTLIVNRQGLFFVSEEQIILAVIIALIISLIVPLIIGIVYRGKVSDKVSGFIRPKGKVVFKVLVLTSAVAAIGSTVFCGFTECNDYADVTMMTLPVIMALTGVLIIPVILVGIARMKYSVRIDDVVIVLFFVYGVLLYSVICRPFVSSYYFEARFLLVYIPIVFLTAGVMLREMKQDGWYIPVMSIIILFIPYTTSVMSNEVDTRLEWDNVTNVIDMMQDSSDDTIILMDVDLMKEYYHLTDSYADRLIYPFDEEIKGQMARDVDILEKKVYYITANVSDNLVNKGRIVYRNDNEQAMLLSSPGSSIINLPSKNEYYSEEFINIIEYDNYYDILERKECDWGNLTYGRICWSVNDIIVEDNVAKVDVSLLRKDSNLLYNDKNLMLSYHLEYKDESLNVYDHERTSIGSGPYINGFAQTLEIPLEKVEEDEVVAVLDIVEEGKSWYSWEYDDCPKIRFNKNEDGWSYVLLGKKINNSKE